VLDLSRRERQIMDVLFRAGQATAAEVLAAIPNPPSYSGVRTILRVLERKRHVVHDVQGTQYVYRPVASEKTVRQSALRHLIRTFFGGRPERAVTAILSRGDVRLSPEDAEELRRLIDRAERRTP
jgi:predicted transcriptional regulator